MAKRAIQTIREKNIVINNIIEMMLARSNFLICGHKSPDEDCIASMVAFAILLTKFDKFPQIYLPGPIPDNLQYLMKICKYNSIRIVSGTRRILNSIDAIVICDTPKPSMLELNSRIARMMKDDSIVKIEIDHHLGGDSDYIGMPEYSLVTAASSSSELVGYLALKLRTRKKLLNKYLISDPFSRNFVLAILTGILGDTQKGQFLKSRREKKFYDIFSGMYNTILERMTVRDTNFTNMEQIFEELQHLTEREVACFNYINERRRFSESIGYVILHEDDMDHLYREFDHEIITTVTKAIANTLAEKSGRLSLICFADQAGGEKLVQFRMRRGHLFRSFDLRDVLYILNIANGGGHEGAIGFRFPQNSIPDVDRYVEEMIPIIEDAVERAVKA